MRSKQRANGDLTPQFRWRNLTQTQPRDTEGGVLMSEAEATAPGPVERRAWVRYVSDLTAACLTGDLRNDVGWPARVRDVSAGGIGLLLRHRFRPGTHLSLEL